MITLYEIYQAIEYRNTAEIKLQEEFDRQEQLAIKQEEAILAYQQAFNKSRGSNYKNLQCGVSNCYYVEVGINYYDLTQPSNLTTEQLSTMLSSVSHSNLPQLAKYFIQAEKEYGVNALFLSSLASLESFYGNSDKAQYKNNLFGFGSNDFNDMTYTFATKGEGILYVAEYLSKNYLSNDGKYYRGGSIWEVNSIYCPDIAGQAPKMWAEKIINIANKYLEVFGQIA